MKDFSGKVGLVTGAASGIGRGTALALARRGATLVLCDIDRDKLNAVRDEVSAVSRVLLAEVVDVASKEQVGAFADLVHDHVSAVDILVNNAGVAMNGGLLDTSLDDWEWIMGINWWGVLYGCHFFVPKMVEQGKGGHVANVSSVLGFWGMADTMAYSSSKFAVRGFSEALRLDLAKHRIGVTTVCPGMISTNIVAQSRWRTTGDKAPNQGRLVEVFKKRGYSAENAGEDIVKAIIKDKHIAPVARDAYLLCALKRLVPNLNQYVEKYAAERLRARLQ